MNIRVTRTVTVTETVEISQPAWLDKVDELIHDALACIAGGMSYPALAYMEEISRLYAAAGYYTLPKPLELLRRDASLATYSAPNNGWVPLTFALEEIRARGIPISSPFIAALVKRLPPVPASLTTRT